MKRSGTIIQVIWNTLPRSGILSPDVEEHGARYPPPLPG
jgi:hypothetical protein